MGFFKQKRKTKEGLEYKYQQSSNRKTSLVTLTIPMTNNTDVSFSPESSLTRFAKKYHLVREMQVEDAAFNERVYIYSDQAAVKDLINQSHELRGAIKEIVCMHSDLEFSSGKLVIKIHTAKKLDAIELDDLLSEVEKHLAIIVKCWNLNLSPMALREEQAAIKKGRSFIIYSVIFALFSLFLRISFKNYNNQLLGNGHAWSICIYTFVSLLILYKILVNQLGQKSRTGFYLAWILPTLLFGMIMFTTAMIPYLNCTWDQSKGEIKVFTVESKSYNRSKNGTQYYLRYDTGISKEPSYKMRVSREEYEVIEEGTGREFRVYPGRLGFIWAKLLEAK